MKASAFAFAGLLALALPLAANAQSVALAGRMGTKALLVIDGQSQMVAVGESARGVKLLSIEDDQARVERDGAVSVLRVGAAPVSLSTAPRNSGASQIVMTAGPGGHFVVGGSINGRSVQFVVDTGASVVSMSRSEADRIGLDYKNAERSYARTANGDVPIHLLTLRSVRVGEIEVANVQAAIMPVMGGPILLGNSFLTRFQMRRENDVMRLEKR